MDDDLLNFKNPRTMRAQRRPGLLHQAGWLLARLVAAFLFLSVFMVVV